MPDGADTGTTTTAATDAGNGNGSGNGGTTAKTFTQEQVNDLIAREKGQIQSKYADYNDLKAAAGKLKEIEDSRKTDLEKLTGERDTFKGQAETLGQQNARLKVALKKGLVGERAELAELLQGKDEAEMEAHADRLLKLVGAGGSTDFDGGPRGDAAPGGDMNAFIRGGSRKRTG